MPSPPARMPPTVPAVLNDESIIAKLIITPLTFLSFLFSLLLVDTYKTSLRAAPAPASTLRGRIAQRLHRCLFRPQQPYRDVRPPGSPPGSPPGGEDAEGEWVWHTKQRKMLKMEVAEAFEIRRWVLVVMGALGCLAALGGWWVVGWVWRAVFGRGGGGGGGTGIEHGASWTKT